MLMITASPAPDSARQCGEEPKCLKTEPLAGGSKLAPCKPYCCALSFQRPLLLPARRVGAMLSHAGPSKSSHEPRDTGWSRRFSVAPSLSQACDPCSARGSSGVLPLPLANLWGHSGATPASKDEEIRAKMGNP